jgi:hypothetical protein
VYVPSALTIGNAAFCIYVFCMILSANRDYLRTQPKEVDICSDEVLQFFEVGNQFLSFI